MNAIDQDLVRQVMAAIDHDAEAIVETLRASVRIPSVTGEEGAAAEFYARELGSLGLEVTTETVDPDRVGDAFEFWDQETDLEQRPNVYAAWPVRGDPPLVFNGHVDVITAGPLDRWSDPPFDAVVRDGRVIGRGAADMKGGLAAALGAVRALRSLGLTPAADLAVWCVMGEETGGLGTIAAVRQGQPVGAAIALEPTGLALAPAQSGHLKFTLSVSGRNAHTSVPWSGVSAFEKLTYLYDGLRALSAERNERVRHPLFDAWPNKAPFAVGLASAGHYGWTLPDRAEARGRFGILPGEHPDAARADIETRLAALCADDPWLREHPAQIQWMFGTFPAWETPGTDPLIAAIRTSLQAVGGSAPERGMTYGCDACHIHRLMGAPVAIFGPGVIEDCHIPNESVAIADVLRAANVLALTALTWKGATHGAR